MGAFAGGMRVFGRRRRGFRRCRAGCCGRRLLVQVKDRGGRVSVLLEDSQGQRGKHEHERRDDRELAQEVGRPSTAEDSLAGAAEGRSDFSALTGLQQNGSNHEQADDDMNDDEQCVHV